LLFSCHALADFGRDLAESEIVEVVIDQTKNFVQVEIPLPANFRKLRRIVALDSDENEIISQWEFEKRTVRPPTDYFDAAVPATYTLVGGVLRIEFRSCLVPPFLRLLYYAYPEFTLTPEGNSAVVTSTSWILDNHPQLLLNYAIAWIAGMSEAGNKAAIDAQLQESKMALVTSEI